jgi:hypothetical protein
MKYNRGLFKKMQNILRNLGVHKCSQKLFRLNKENKFFHNIFKSIIKFLILFTQYNSINQQ